MTLTQIKRQEMDAQVSISLSQRGAEQEIHLHKQHSSEILVLF